MEGCPLLQLATLIAVTALLFLQLWLLHADLRARTGLGSQLFTRADNSRTGGNGLKLKEGRLRLEVRGKLLTERVVKCWNRLPSEVVDASSLGTFKARLTGL